MPINLDATSAASAGTAYRALRDQIRRGALHPGHPLTESQAAADLNAGTAAVGDAFALLMRDGLIHRAPPGGYEVASPTLKSVDDLFVAWRLIGPELVRLGVERATAAQLAGMREIVADYEAWTARSLADRVSRFYEHAVALFQLLATAADNEQLAETYRGMGEDMYRVWYLPVAEAARSGTPRPTDTGLGAALGRRDGELAARGALDFITATHAQARRLARSCDVISLDSERARRRTEGTRRASTRRR